jgi:hypothetical protein
MNEEGWNEMRWLKQDWKIGGTSEEEDGMQCSAIQCLTG